MALIAHWPLNGNTLDYSGYNRHGSEVGITFDSGKIGHAATFSGGSSGNRVEVEGFEYPRIFSVTMWFYFEENTLQTSFYQYMIGQAVSAGWNDSAFAILRYHSHDNRLYIYVKDSEGNNRTITTVYPSIEEWNHLAVTVGSNRMTVYLNGVETASTSLSFDQIFKRTDDINIGSNSRRVARSFHGQINDIRIYDHVLSINEIKEISRAKVLHYNFNDFQEPTENLVDPDIRTWNTGSTIIDEINPYIYKITNPNTGSGVDWRRPRIIVPVEEGDEIALSYDYYGHTQEVSVRLRLYRHDGTNSYINTRTFSKDVEYARKRYSQTVTMPSNARDIRIYLAVWNRVGDVDISYSLTIGNIQLEKKSRATPFTENKRIGIIRDISGFGNNAILCGPTLSKIPFHSTPSGASHNGSYGLRFTVSRRVKLISALVRPYFSGEASAQLYDFNTQELLSEMEFDAINGVVQRIVLDIECEPGVNYWLTTSGGNFMRTNSGLTFPKTHDPFTFTTPSNASGSTATRWYYFFDIEYESVVDELDTSPQWIEDDSFGGGYRFGANGTHNTIRLPDTLGSTNAITVATWFKSAGTPGSGFHILMGGQSIEMSVPTAGAARIGCVINNVRQVHNHGSGLTDGNWHHIAMTYDGSRKKAYIDGNLVGDVSVPGTIRNTFNDRTIGVYGNDTSYWTNGYQTDVRIYATALTHDDIRSIYNNRIIIDDHGTIQNTNIISVNRHHSLIDYMQWNIGTGSCPGFARNGSDSENHRIIGPDPWGNDTIIWEARPDAVSGADGGWNGSNFTIDNKRLYRFSVWVHRNQISNGRFYLGLNGYGSTNGVLNMINRANNTNPYFYHNVDNIPTGEWVLVVGHVWPFDTDRTTNHSDSGLYSVNGHKIMNINTDYIWRAETDHARHRSYLYYATDTTQRQRWVYPRVDICDGTEPSINELLSGLDGRIYKYLSGNSKGIAFSNSNVTYDKINENTLTSNLITYLPLENDITDHSGNFPEISGTYPDISFIDGRRCVSMDSGKTIVFQDNKLGRLNSYTYVFWYRFDEEPTGSWRSFLRRSGGGTNRSPGLWRYTNNYGFHFQQRLGNNEIHGGGVDVTGLQRHTWYFVAFRCDFDGTNTRLSSFVNGSFRHNTYNNMAPFLVDANLTLASTGHALTGFRLYNRVLTDDEIRLIYNMERPDSDTKVTILDNIVYTKGQIKEGL